MNKESATKQIDKTSKRAPLGLLPKKSWQWYTTAFNYLFTYNTSVLKYYFEQFSSVLDASVLCIEQII